MTMKNKQESRAGVWEQEVLDYGSRQAARIIELVGCRGACLKYEMDEVLSSRQHLHGGWVTTSV